MKLSEKIDHNIWVTVDGELLQLRPLVDQVEEEIAAFKETVERYFNDSGYEKAEDALRAYAKV